MYEEDNQNKSKNIFKRPQLSQESERAIYMDVYRLARNYTITERRLFDFLNDYDELNYEPETHPFQRLNEAQVVRALSRTRLPELKSEIIKSSVEISSNDNPMLAIYILLHGKAAAVARKLKTDSGLNDMVSSYTADAYYRASDSSSRNSDPKLAFEIATAARHNPVLDTSPFQKRENFDEISYSWEWIQRQRDMLDFLICRSLRKDEAAADFSVEASEAELEWFIALISWQVN